MAVECFYGKEDHPGRSQDAHTNAARGVYEALTQLGVAANVKHLHDFDFAADGPPRLVVLPNLVAMSDRQAAALTAFARAGNTVLATGQTGMYGERAQLWPAGNPYPLAELLGGTIREMRLVDERFDLALADPGLTLPCHLLQGEIGNASGQVIAERDGRVLATRHRVGDGEAIWIPSMIALGAWLFDPAPQAELLGIVGGPFLADQPFRFAERTPGCLLRVMQAGDRRLTIVTNGTADRRRAVLATSVDASPRVLWQRDADISADGTDIALGPRETVVVLWK
jgi:beta-galactosidase